MQESRRRLLGRLISVAEIRKPTDLYLVSSAREQVDDDCCKH